MNSGMTLASMHPEVWLAGGYALALLVIAALLEYAARRTHGRTETVATAGFRFHARLNVWECGQGQHLWPVRVDRERRQLHYRAQPQVCRMCPVKQQCHDADGGRTLVQPLDVWPHSEVARFHRGLSLLLVLLAAVIAGGGLVRHHDDPSLTLLAPVLAATLWMGHRKLAAFRARQPSGAATLFAAAPRDGARR